MMTSPTPDELNAMRRQHPAALLWLAGKRLREQWGWMIILVIGSIRRDRKTPEGEDAEFWQYLAFGSLAIGLIILIDRWLYYLRLQYRIEADRLVVQQGLFTRKKMVLPRMSLQSIQQSQSLLHRLTGTCQLVIDTTGAGKEELRLHALSIPAAAELLAWAGRPATGMRTMPSAATHTEPEPFYRLDQAGLLRLIISENHLKTLALLLAFFANRVQDLRDILGFNAWDYAEDAGKVGWRSWLAVAMFLLAVSVVVSAVRVALRYSGYRIWLKPGLLQMQWGLLETRRHEVAQQKIRVVSWHTNWLRQRLGLYVVRLHTVAEDQLKDKLWIRIPLSGRKAVMDLATAALQEIPASHKAAVQGIYHRYAHRFSTMSILVWLVVAIPLAIWAGWAWVAVSAMLPGYVVWAVHRYQSRFRWWMSPANLQITRGVWGEKTEIVDLGHVQSMAIKRTPAQRKLHLASLTLHAPGHSVTIPWIPLPLAQMLMNTVTPVGCWYDLQPNHSGPTVDLPAPATI